MKGPGSRLDYMNKSLASLQKEKVRSPSTRMLNDGLPLHLGLDTATDQLRTWTTVWGQVISITSPEVSLANRARKRAHLLPVFRTVASEGDSFRPQRGRLHFSAF